MEEIIIATHNKGKAIEFKELFKKHHIKAPSLLDIDDNLPEIEETGLTFAENAILKAQGIADRLQKPVLADDSGLVVDALQGRPGIYSARYAGEDKSDDKNNQKILEELQDIPINDRTARFVTVLALIIPGKEPILKSGECQGVIAYNPSGDHGFGYDPIFIPNGYQQTMAELPAHIKNEISHRRDAMNKLDDWLTS